MLKKNFKSACLCRNYIETKSKIDIKPYASWFNILAQSLSLFLHICSIWYDSDCLKRWCKSDSLLLDLKMFLIQLSSVQLLSRVQLFPTPWITARQASLSITISWSSLKLTSIESVMPSSHLILCHPLLLLSPIPPSIRVFSNSSHEVAKVLEFQL